MSISLRTWYDEPGDPLFLPVHLFDHSLDIIRFGEDSGIAPDNLVLSNLVTFPIPRLFTQEGPRGVAGLKPEFLAHPLVWLPRRLAGPYVLERDDEGQPSRVETKDHHLVRIAIEMVTSGLYNEPEGKWIDVFALMNLDPEDPETLARAQAWLEGRDDIALDSFSLNDYLSHDESVADQHASDMMEFLYTEAYALQSHSLNQLVTDLTTGQIGEIPARTFGRNISTWALGALPQHRTPNLTEWTPWDEYDDELAVLDGDDEDQIMAVLERMGAQLWGVREYYWELREINREAVEEELAKEGITPEMLAGEDTETEWARVEEAEIPMAAISPAPETATRGSTMLALPAAPAAQDVEELEDPFADKPETADTAEVEVESNEVAPSEELEDPFEEDQDPDSDRFTW